MTPIPGPPASVLSAVLVQNPNDPDSPLRLATFSQSGEPPLLPSLMNDVVAMPQDALLDANGTWTGFLSTLGLTGATAPSRYVGATVSGAPVRGNFLAGDWLIDQSGAAWICTVPGSPGTWQTPAVSLSGVTVTGTPAAGQVLTATSTAAASWKTAPVAWVNAVTAYGADPTGTTDSATAIQNAITALPHAGGVVYLPTGTYKVASGNTIIAKLTSSSTGPIYLAGDGRWATLIKFTGTGDCIRMYNSVAPGGNFTNIVNWGGGILGITIDGTSAGNSSTGLHLGDGEEYVLDAAVRHFNGTGSIGYHQDNTLWWTEKTHGYLMLEDNTTLVAFDVNGSPNTSHAYTNLALDLYATAGQTGISVLNGAVVYHSTLKIKGNFLAAASGTAAPAININASKITNSHIDLQLETSTSSVQPQTFNLSGGGLFKGCYGMLHFGDGGAWTASNVSANAQAFTFFGPVVGDTTIGGYVSSQGYSGVAAVNTPYIYGQSLLNGATGVIYAGYADFFQCTLSASITIALGDGSNIGAPQRKTLVITQAASGGPYTVSWPASGSPTTSSPNVVWPGAVTPAMPATASAVAVYHLETFDGATWYGQQLAPAAGAASANFKPSNPGNTTSTSLVMMGLGGTCVYTPAASGIVQVTVTGYGQTLSSPVGFTVGARYGTSTAPSNGNGVTGARFGAGGDPGLKCGALGDNSAFAFTDILSLTAGTAYWFDLALSTANGSDAAEIVDVSMSFVELPR